MPWKDRYTTSDERTLDRVLQKHAGVGELVDNEWLHLFQIDATERAVFARRNGEWKPAPP